MEGLTMKNSLYAALLVFAFCLILSGDGWAQNPAAEWQKSKHSDRELPANDVGVWELRNLDTAMCGRCHTEQGFKAWAPQLMRGDPAPIKKPNGEKADEAFIKELGMTKAEVRPITCVACHSQGAELRVKDDIPMLPNGLAVRAAGKGALCMACHNTRNGRIAWDTPAKNYMQPHNASQTDVLLGKNVYFYNDTVDSESPHAAFTKDSCVECHQTLGTGGHTFKPAECGACHGDKVKEAFVQNGVGDLQKQLAAAILKKLMASKEKVACVTSYDLKLDKDTANVAVDGKQIRAIEIPPDGIHGQISLKLTLGDRKEIYSQMGNIKDGCGVDGKPVFEMSNPVIGALWNYLLIQYDGSKGVHNPRFTRNVLITTIDTISK
jgi:cytochrome c553